MKAFAICTLAYLVALAAAVVVQCIEGLTHKLVVHGENDADTEPYVEEMVALVTAYLAAD